MSKFSQFPDYQTLEKGSKGAPAKANRSIPDRVEDYGLLKYLTKKSSVLDLGCNRGFFGTFLSPHIKRYVGIEGDANQLKHSLKKSNMELRHMDYKPLNDKFDVILCLAFHSYVGIQMHIFADELNAMLEKGGTIFLEGHPAGYRGEPEQHFTPLKSALMEHGFKPILEKSVKDRELLRPFVIFQK